MMAGVAQLSFLIADISATSRDQAASLAEVNGALGQMDQVTQQNVAMVEESKAATLSLEGAAANLATLVARFKTGAGQISSRAATKAPSLALPPMASPARALQRRAANGMGATAQATDSWERL
jgi:methyl-accepting chemotaxis protein